MLHLPSLTQINLRVVVCQLVMSTCLSFPFPLSIELLDGLFSRVQLQG
jgi:hypothetical protein